MTSTLHVLDRGRSGAREEAPSQQGLERSQGSPFPLALDISASPRGVSKLSTSLCPFGLMASSPCPSSRDSAGP